MFTAERMGLLAVAVLLLFIGAVSMCSRGGWSSGRDVLTPDSALVRQIDSLRNAPADSVKPQSKKSEKKSRAKDTKKSNPAPRNYYDERVD